MRDDTHISLAHGNGGRLMRELIAEVFARHLANPDLDVTADAVPLEMDSRRLMFTTDGFTVKPLEFPGGDIGALAVHGTCNDLAVAGATPRFLSLNAFIEEGLEIRRLDRFIASMAEAARELGVRIVTGDTKVVPRGEGSGLYLATSGLGVCTHERTLSIGSVNAGDAVLVSGPVGDHGTAVLLAREQFGLTGTLKSDVASVLPLTQALLRVKGLKFMRDPTRGGLASVAHEVARVARVTVRLRAEAVPVRNEVRSVCEMLGYDPYYLACEGRVVAFVTREDAAEALASWRRLADGREAAIVGHVESPGEPRVILETPLGGERFLEELEDDPLPRIC